MVTRTPPALVPPAVLELAEKAWRERARRDMATTSDCRDAAATAAYLAGLAAATPLNDNAPSSCWALRERVTYALKCVAHGQNGGQQLAKILAQVDNPRAYELIRWDGLAWVVVAGVA